MLEDGVESPSPEPCWLADSCEPPDMDAGNPALCRRSEEQGLSDTGQFLQPPFVFISFPISFLSPFLCSFEILRFHLETGGRHLKLAPEPAPSGAGASYYFITAEFTQVSHLPPGVISFSSPWDMTINLRLYV